MLNVTYKSVVVLNVIVLSVVTTHCWEPGKKSWVQTRNLDEMGMIFVNFQWARWASTLAYEHVDPAQAFEVNRSL